jgi:hypothetical protein
MRHGDREKNNIARGGESMSDTSNEPEEESEEESEEKSE